MFNFSRETNNIVLENRQWSNLCIRIKKIWSSFLSLWACVPPRKCLFSHGIPSRTTLLIAHLPSFFLFRLLNITILHFKGCSLNPKANQFPRSRPNPIITTTALARVINLYNILVVNFTWKNTTYNLLATFIGLQAKIIRGNLQSLNKKEVQADSPSLSNNLWEKNIHTT